MSTHPFKRTHARILLYGILIVLVALGGCAAPTPGVVQKVVTQVVEKSVVQQVETQVVEKVVTQTPAPAEVELTFWAPASPEDDMKTISGLLKTFTIKVVPTFQQPAHDEYYTMLGKELQDGKGPDLAELPLPVPENFGFGKDLGVGSPWLLCNSLLFVSAKSAHPDEAAKLREYLTSPSESVCYGGLPITFVPYAAPPPPAIIGEATPVVPDDPVIVGGVAALKDQLIAANATINVARAVVLTDTSTGETTYMAPVGFPLTQGPTDEKQMKDGMTIAMVVVKPGVADLKLPEGAYLVKDFLEGGSETWTVRFIDVNGNSKAEINGVKGEDPSFNTDILAGLPSAGIVPGCLLCRSCKCVERRDSKCVKWKVQTYCC
jgi:ABC-type glycerol-3-phosphate transport system substrate-binding protein